MHTRARKMPANLTTNASRVAVISTDEAPKPAKKKGKNPAAVALGKLGGSKGGKARTLALSPKERSDIARNAAEKRWSDDA